MDIESPDQKKIERETNLKAGDPKNVSHSPSIWRLLMLLVHRHATHGRVKLRHLARSGWTRRRWRRRLLLLVRRWRRRGELSTSSSSRGRGGESTATARRWRWRGEPLVRRWREAHG